MLAAPLNPNEQIALHVLFEAIDYSDLPDEEWRDIVGYEGMYQVSNYSRVKSFQRSKVKIIKADIIHTGYSRVVLYKNGETKSCYVHVLAAQAFIPNPEGKTQVNHIDGNKQNNHISNLEWVTPSENIVHSFKVGLSKKGCEHGRAKLTSEQIREIRRDCVPNDPERGFRALAKKFNVTHRVIADVFNGKSYQTVE